MKLNLIFQAILILSILVILSILYYTFLLNKDSKTSTLSENIEQVDHNLDNKIANELNNIEYNSSDNKGNTFYINAKRAIIELDENNSNSNKVKLEKVISIINLKNKGIINVYSNDAIYDKVYHDTLFFNNVKIEYLDNSILSENLDLLFTKKISKIYNNVVYKNNYLNLNTDKIIIDMITGDLKLEMNNKKEKVKLITKYEFN
jgi:hypothetical protein|tara:strand:+ start:1332 stop:1943 length:612 start_codon:yes stop_codon:yes gene_type:complete